jgi:hypothetical protein
MENRDVHEERGGELRAVNNASEDLVDPGDGSGRKTMGQGRREWIIQSGSV